MSIKQRIKAFTDYKKISDRQFSISIGASPGYVNSISKSIQPDKLHRITIQYPELNPIWLMTGEGDMLSCPDVNIAKVDVKEKFPLQTERILDSQLIPLYELEATAGIRGQFISQSQQPLERIYIPNLSACDGAMFVRGDSMTPYISSGDIILFKQVKNIPDGIFWDNIYLISFSLAGEDHLAVKFVRKSDEAGYVTLKSFNPEHKPQDIPIASIQALAIVKAAVKYTTMI